jgi:outer membrane protein OmpA-like peptidoglycan-associated protein
MRFRSALLAATVLAVPFAAQAQGWTPGPVTGLYIGAGAGVNIKDNPTLKNLSLTNSTTGGVAVSNTKLTTAAGPIALGYIGWGFGNGLRVEVEGDYRNNQFNGLNHTGPLAGVPADSSGHEQLYGPMFNVAYDFYNLTPYVVPYIGAGVGAQWASLENFSIFASGPHTSGAITSDNNSKVSFAYQVIAGLALPISSLPGLSLTAEYRFLGTTGNRNYNAAGAIVGPTGTVRVATGSLQLANEYNNAFLLGVRYAFGVAPPPPAPAPVAAPAPAPARSYLVFFDWDKATLTDRAREIIREAAANSTHVQFTQIVVNGYTDTSGTPKYNMGLSIRRANAVAAELVRDGVPKNVISIHGFGETHLLVPTGPGVREPQNRRVEIIIQ